MAEAKLWRPLTEAQQTGRERERTLYKQKERKRLNKWQVLRREAQLEKAESAARLGKTEADDNNKASHSATGPRSQKGKSSAAPPRGKQDKSSAIGRRRDQQPVKPFGARNEQVRKTPAKKSFGGPTSANKNVAKKAKKSKKPKKPFRVKNRLGMTKKKGSKRH